MAVLGQAAVPRDASLVPALEEDAPQLLLEFVPYSNCPEDQICTNTKEGGARATGVRLHTELGESSGIPGGRGA